MKKFILTLPMLFLAFAMNAQIAYQQGDSQLNFGINLGQGPGIYGSYEVGITDNISIGGEAAIGFRAGVGSVYYASYNYFQANFRFSGFANYHFAQLVGLPDEWDLYGGADIGYSIWTKNSTTSDPEYYWYSWNNSSFMIGAHGGGRWFWNEKWGVMAEIGGGYGYFVAKGGLTLKL